MLPTERGRRIVKIITKIKDVVTMLFEKSPSCIERGPGRGHEMNRIFDKRFAGFRRFESRLTQHRAKFG